MNTYSRLLRQLKNNSYTCQVTGVAGHQHDLEYCQQTCHGIHYVLMAVGDRTTLTENGESNEKQVVYRDFKLRDVRHGKAGVSKAEALFSYAPEYRIMDGIAKSMPWYVRFLK